MTFTTTSLTSSQLTFEGLKAKNQARSTFFNAVLTEVAWLYAQKGSGLKAARQSKKEATTQLRYLMELSAQDEKNKWDECTSIYNIYPFLKAEALVVNVLKKLYGAQADWQQLHAKSGLWVLSEQAKLEWIKLVELTATEESKPQLITLLSNQDILFFEDILPHIALKLIHPHIRLNAPNMSSAQKEEMDARKVRLINLSVLYALTGHALPKEEIDKFTNWLTDTAK